MNTLRRKMHRAFTLVEIMIVVLIMSILLAVAAPNLVKARNTSRAKACIQNLKMIDSSAEQYLMENRTTVYPSNFTPLVPNFMKSTPLCPSGGTYTLPTSTTWPTCNIGTNGTSITSDDHVLP